MEDVTDGQPPSEDVDMTDQISQVDVRAGGDMEDVTHAQSPCEDMDTTDQTSQVANPSTGIPHRRSMFLRRYEAFDEESSSSEEGMQSLTQFQRSVRLSALRNAIYPDRLNRREQTQLLRANNWNVGAASRQHREQRILETSYLGRGEFEEDAEALGQPPDTEGLCGSGP